MANGAIYESRNTQTHICGDIYFEFKIKRERYGNNSGFHFKQTLIRIKLFLRYPFDIDGVLKLVRKIRYPPPPVSSLGHYNYNLFS